jgi:protein involved in polysaccharide export with SLBB domain
VHIGDVVDVDVVGNLEFDWRGTLTPEGYLDGLDKIEEQIYALCRSEPEIASDIAKQYGKILRDPNIIVRIVDRTNRAVAIVTGAVRTPQRFQIKRPVYLRELIVLTGGITENSNGEINVFRPQTLNCVGNGSTKGEAGAAFVNTRQGNGSQTINIRIADLLGGSPGSNPQILSGDIVSVAEASPIYVIGGVNNPRQLSSKSEVTLTRAIASAGGLAKEAVDENITIFRRSDKETQTISADLRKITAKQADDIVLKAFDIVDVGQKGRDKRKFPPAIDRTSSLGRRLNLPLSIID